MSKLDDYLNKKIAEDLGIKPEQVTLTFLHEMRKRMYADPEFQFDRSTRYLKDPDVHQLTPAEKEAWHEKCRKWAQEVLRTGPTSCAAPDLLKKELDALTDLIHSRE